MVEGVGICCQKRETVEARQNGTDRGPLVVNIRILAYASLISPFLVLAYGRGGLRAHDESKRGH